MNTYLYGTGEVSAQEVNSTADMEYFLGDKVGSVRQLTDDDGAVT